ncbi:MAG: YIP1 family protein [Amaricoccus sp.]
MTQMWLELARDSLVDPREAARRLLALRFGQSALLMAAVVVTCLGIILAYAAIQFDKPDVDAVSAELLGTPLLGALLELAVTLAVGYLTWRIGALFGGRGAFWDAILLVVWLNAMLLLLQTLQLVALATVPFLAGVVALLRIPWAFWAYANFVTELHGFDNRFMVLGSVVLTAIVLFIALAMLFAFLGLTPHEVG